MALSWTKEGRDGYVATAGIYTLLVRAKGDGRWDWAVTREGGRNPEATGIARSEGAAKTVSTQYVERTGAL